MTDENDVPTDAVVSTHWHVRIESIDTELFMGDTVFAALEYAGAELNSLADWLFDGITVAGNAGLYKLAYSRFQLTWTYWNLAEDAGGVVANHDDLSATEHADTIAATLLDSAYSVVDAINAGTPEGFMIHECPLGDECAPTVGEG